MKQLSFSVILGTAFGFLLAGYMALAFSEPSLDPPAGNTKPPLNESVDEQIKDGDLELNKDKIIATGLQIWEGYTQVDTTSLPGQPPAFDCNTVGEWGRMVLNYTNDRLFICDPGGAGWGFSLLFVAP